MEEEGKVKEKDVTKAMNIYLKKYEKEKEKKDEIEK